MKPTDTISILVCVHSQDADHDAMLQRALESLVRQTYSGFDVVVVLDECWDYTEAVVEPYKDVIPLSVFKRPHKQGLAAAKNFGISHCTGDWIGYLDADDSYMDCKLEVQRNFMLDNPGIDFCGTESWDLDCDILYPNCFGVGQYKSHEQIKNRLPFENILCHGSMLIRRNVLELLGGYDTSRNVLGKEDWDLWLRACRAGYVFGKVPERLYVWSAGTSVSR
jgi:glycosyltransferase involved in cell wall biosynthesis